MSIEIIGNDLNGTGQHSYMGLRNITVILFFPVFMSFYVVGDFLFVSRLPRPK